MKVNLSFFDDEVPIKYYYCCTNNKEYILTGTKDGYMFNSNNSYNIGDIIVSIMENKDCIIQIIEKYINIIESEKSNNNEIDNQNLVLYNLDSLQSEFFSLKLNIHNYINFSTDIQNKFIEKMSELNLEKEKYNAKNTEILQLKDLINIDKFPENQNVLNFLCEQNHTTQQKVEELENLSFKDFVLEYLNNFLLDFTSSILNFILYFGESKKLKVAYDNKQIDLSNTVERKKLLQINYNDVSANKNISWTKLAFICGEKIYLEDSDEIENYNIEDIKMLHIFEFNNLIDLFNLLLVNSIDKKITIKKCKNCNNFFIPESRTDEVYCNRISPQNPNKTCKEYGAKKTYRDEIKSTPIKYEHNKTSQFYRMRINRSKTPKEKEKYQKKFDIYKKNYQKKKQKYQSHRLEELAFVEWIRNQKEF